MLLSILHEKVGGRLFIHEFRHGRDLLLSCGEQVALAQGKAEGMPHHDRHAREQLLVVVLHNGRLPDLCCASQGPACHPYGESCKCEIFAHGSTGSAAA